MQEQGLRKRVEVSRKAADKVSARRGAHEYDNAAAHACEASGPS